MQHVTLTLFKTLDGMDVNVKTELVFLLWSPPIHDDSPIVLAKQELNYAIMHHARFNVACCVIVRGTMMPDSKRGIQDNSLL